MWYEILPSAAIVSACLLAPNYVHWATTKLFCNGRVCLVKAENTVYYRHWQDWFYHLIMHYCCMRDEKQLGNIFIGITVIPDHFRYLRISLS
ncbi:hypothetical protein ACJMK2_018324 [Sinanodonta woodiana]|uniref:Secreted protein n=1 Tax=Sinanodonta woodiana TaxID=1069815 RepID=A0ABD3UF40_SINWO